MEDMKNNTEKLWLTMQLPWKLYQVICQNTQISAIKALKSESISKDMSRLNLNAETKTMTMATPATVMDQKKKKMKFYLKMT